MIQRIPNVLILKQKKILNDPKWLKGIRSDPKRFQRMNTIKKKPKDVKWWKTSQTILKDPKWSKRSQTIPSVSFDMLPIRQACCLSGVSNDRQVVISHESYLRSKRSQIQKFKRSQTIPKSKISLTIQNMPNHSKRSQMIQKIPNNPKGVFGTLPISQACLLACLPLTSVSFFHGCFYTSVSPGTLPVRQACRVACFLFENFLQPKRYQKTQKISNDSKDPK